MIAKMTRYDILLLGKDRDDILKGIRDTGLMDIRRSAKAVDEWSQSQIERLDRLRYTFEHLEELDYSDDPQYAKIVAISRKYPKFTEGFKEKYLSRAELLDSTLADLAAAEAEVLELAPWGEFDSAVIADLNSRGCALHFYRCERSRFDERWAEKWALEKISEEGGSVRFVIVSDNSGFPLQELDPPAYDKTVARMKVNGLREKVIICKASLLAMKNQVQEIRDRYELVLNDLNLYLASKATDEEVEGKICIITGFVPTDSTHDVDVALNGMDLYFISAPATREDNPPIKLRNNRFARLFETLTGMYGMPVYDEFDPTPVLAPFFMLFWAFCMGDAGYGLVLIAVGILLRRVDILGLKPHWKLVTTLGVGAAIIGFFLGTFFGIPLAEVSAIPEDLRKMMLAGKIDVGGSAYDLPMVAAIAVGVFHICLAMVIKAVGLTRRFGFKSAISAWGWNVVIIGGLTVAALALTSVLSSEITRIAVIVIGVIALLSIYLFNTPGRNPLKNLGSGLWDTYNMATGILGDVLSYIRLYALGLAGGMLGNAFNDLASMTLGDNPSWQWIPFLLIALLGHTLNFAMSCLGAFVHPLRLTFVEYFKNSGYEGKGTGYNPLKIEKTNDKQ